MSYRYLYIGIIFIIIVYGLYNYLDTIEKHNNELRRIEILEKKMNQRNYQINQARLNTQPCHIPDLNTPKECYIDSRQECKWSVEADRCNIVDQEN
jgi:hypothetical protein